MVKAAFLLPIVSVENDFRHQAQRQRREYIHRGMLFDEHSGQENQKNERNDRELPQETRFLFLAPYRGNTQGIRLNEFIIKFQFVALPINENAASLEAAFSLSVVFQNQHEENGEDTHYQVQDQLKN
ncbi:MAG: hypothetical protein IKP72_13900 [Clostridia bacterium]|nr:hypothetical protein [Clostridia bacterium]